jgi:hypothetical protein
VSEIAQAITTRIRLEDRLKIRAQTIVVAVWDVRSFD